VGQQRRGDKYDASPEKEGPDQLNASLSISMILKKEEADTQA
jgi:hypothetical protein